MHTDIARIFEILDAPDPEKWGHTDRLLVGDIAHRFMVLSAPDERSPLRRHYERTVRNLPAEEVRLLRSLRARVHRDHGAEGGDRLLAAALGGLTASNPN